MNPKQMKKSKKSCFGFFYAINSKKNHIERSVLNIEVKSTSLQNSYGQYHT